MKKQLFKGLLAFSIALFSIFSSSAQCKKNEVLVCHISRATGYLVCQCVHKTHLNTYLRNGWIVNSSSVVAKNDPIDADKNFQANPGSNSLNATKKMGVK
jgi:hypothetical protein